jgi:hypothetical protein
MSDSLEARVAALEARIAALESGATAAAALPQVDIDEPQWGDPLIRVNPPKWKGQPFKGSPMSLCSPEFLRAFASFKQWCAGKERREGKEKYAGYSMRDAAKALAWAARLEMTKAAKSAPSVPQDLDDPEADVFQGQFDDGHPF